MIPSPRRNFVRNVWMTMASGLLASEFVWSQQPTLRIGSWVSNEVAASELALSRAYERLGIQVQFVELPIRRALVNLLAGELDGNLYRIADLVDREPSLVRVETPIVVLAARVYQPKQKSNYIDHWLALSGKNVAYLRGTLSIERHLEPGAHRMEAGSEAEAFKMVQKGMADVAVLMEPEESQPHALAQQNGLQRTGASLVREPLHHYLHARHRELAGRLNQELRKMQISGELREIQSKAAGTASSR